MELPGTERSGRRSEKHGVRERTEASRLEWWAAACTAATVLMMPYKTDSLRFFNRKCLPFKPKLAGRRGGKSSPSTRFFDKLSLSKTPEEFERTAALPKINRTRRRVRRVREVFCGRKNLFTEISSFPCSVRARKSDRLQRKLEGVSVAWELAPPSARLSKSFFTGGRRMRPGHKGHRRGFRPSRARLFSAAPPVKAGRAQAAQERAPACLCSARVPFPARTASEDPLCIRVRKNRHRAALHAIARQNSSMIARKPKLNAEKRAR